jgi:hypothetical protein
MTPLKLAEGLTDELLEVIGRYEESMPLVSVLGVLEVIKAHLIRSHMEDTDEEDWE